MIQPKPPRWYDGLKKTAVKGLTITSGLLTFPSVLPPMEPRDTFRFSSQAQPGDLVLTTSQDRPLFNTLARLGYGSEYGHMGMYVADDAVMASKPGGVDFESPLSGTTHLALIRPRYAHDGERLKTGLRMVDENRDLPYDWLSRGEGVTCTDAVNKVLPERLQVARTSLVGESIVTPKAFQQASDKFEVVMTSKPPPLWKQWAGVLPAIGLTVAGGVAGSFLLGAAGAVAGAAVSYFAGGLAIKGLNSWLQPPPEEQDLESFRVEQQERQAAEAELDRLIQKRPAVCHFDDQLQMRWNLGPSQRSGAPT